MTVGLWKKSSARPEGGRDGRRTTVPSGSLGWALRQLGSVEND